MKKFYLENPFRFADCLKDRGEPFSVISTSFTKTIIRGEREYGFTQTGKLKMRDLNLIRAVKNHCEKLNISIDVNRSNIGYIKTNDNFKAGTYTKDIYEIDLKGAYWNLAYKHNFITEAIYNKGMNLDETGKPIPPLVNRWGNVYNQVSKMGRLIALGNLAKTFKVFEFDGLKYSAPKTVRSELTENIFYKCSQETDAIMKMLTLLAGKDYLFYWVDAIFVRGMETVNKICDYITNEIGMEFKTVPIYKLKKTDSYICLWDKLNLDKDKNMIPRPYIFKSVPQKELTGLLDINKNLIYKDHWDKFFKK